MSVTEPLRAPSEAASCVRGQRKPFSCEDQALAATTAAATAATRSERSREARKEQIDHARLDGEPGQGVDGLERHEERRGVVPLSLSGKAMRLSFSLSTSVSARRGLGIPTCVE